MKKLYLILLCLHLLWGVGFATDSVVLGVGTVTVKTTVPEVPSALAFISNDVKALAHDTSGTSWNVGYQKILDNGLLWGAGYQSFAVSSGSKSVNVSGILTLTLETKKFQVAGIYGEIGYNLKATENLFFQPSLRLGIGNKKESSYSFEVATSSGPLTENLSGDVTGATVALVLPLVYQVDNLNFGGQILFPRSGLILEDIDSGGSVKSELSTAFQFVTGYNF